MKIKNPVHRFSITALRSVVAMGSALLLLGLAQTAQAGITGSKHDFSASGYGTDRICVLCHTPHNSDTTVSDAPLWNHQVTTTSFTVYSSSTLNIVSLGQPDGVSKLCLSCHDGSVSVDNYGGVTTNTGNEITGNANLGNTLINDHPISFTYDSALVNADTELVAANDANVVALLFSSKVECASCHDVHNTAGNSYLLRVVNTGSALCLTCHVK